MKKTITTAAFALLLAAGASQAAFAQDQGGRGQRGGGQQGGGQQGGFQPRDDQQRGASQGSQGGQGGERRDQGPAQAQAAPQAREAPQAQQAQQFQAQPQRQGPPSRASLAEDARRQREQGQAQGQGFRNDQPRAEAPRAQPQQFDPRRNGGGQAFDRNQNDRNQADRNQADRNRVDQNRNWNGGRDNNYAREQWQRGRFPPVYQSQQRFRIDRYRAPSGFYVRQWGFGDILPRAWYGSQYYLSDFDYYGLPYPPPGMEWIRVGDDALLVDRFTGRVVQVVRYLFW